MSVQPLPINTKNFELSGTAKQSLLWMEIDTAERIFSLLLLLLFFPLLAFAVAVTAILSRRPPLIAHQRIGQHGRRIWVVKLRTMWDTHPGTCRRSGLLEPLQPEPTSPFRVKSRHDPRVTSRFAALCRKYSIDELPQLWHVLRGELALVGPRPLTASELDSYYGATASELLSRKPGLSGLWQIRGRNRLSYHKRRRLDLFMVRNWSLPLYVRILTATVPAVLSGRDAW